jgi:muskelin
MMFVIASFTCLSFQVTFLLFFSLFFHSQKNRKIYIFGGQRGKENCADFLKYDVDASTIMTVQTSSTEPDASAQSIFTGPSLASIDTEKGELFALHFDSLWIFSLATSEWTMIYKNSTQTMVSSPECFFFDSIAKRHFMIKGNSEFCLDLSKPSRDNIFSYCKYLIRKQNYEEITRTNSINALFFLRKDLAETIDQNDDEQVNDFHKLASLLFCNKTSSDDTMRESDKQEDHNKIRSQRSCLFNKLIELLPEQKCQPRPNLTNFINI